MIKMVARPRLKGLTLAGKICHPHWVRFTPCLPPGWRQTRPCPYTRRDAFVVGSVPMGYTTGAGACCCCCCCCRRCAWCACAWCAWYGLPLAPRLPRTGGRLAVADSNTHCRVIARSTETTRTGAHAPRTPRGMLMFGCVPLSYGTRTTLQPD